MFLKDYYNVNYSGLLDVVTKIVAGCLKITKDVQFAVLSYRAQWFGKINDR